MITRPRLLKWSTSIICITVPSLYMDAKTIYLIGVDVDSHTKTINETYVDQLTDRVVYRRWHCDDLRVVPFNLQMMMD
jgi:hypothetical protein